MIDSGQLGDIVEAEFHFDRFRPELSAKLHKEVAIEGTGALYDLGSHLIDQSLQLFGVPAAVFADILMVRPGSVVDDFFEVLMFYPGKRVRLRSSYLVREALPATVIHGSRGSFIKPRGDVQEADLQAGKPLSDPDWGKESDDHRGLLHTEKEGDIQREYLSSLKGNYMDYYEGMHQAITQGGAVPVEPEDAVNVVRIIEAAFLSHREGRRVKI